VRASRSDDFQVEGFESVADGCAEKAMKAALGIRDDRSDERARIVAAIVAARAGRDGGEEDDDDASSEDDDFADDDADDDELDDASIG
jgi:hypothetical protein